MMNDTKYHQYRKRMNALLEHDLNMTVSEALKYPTTYFVQFGASLCNFARIFLP
jgi:hypothetical protein